MKKIKILTIALIIVVITMIAFFGLYTKVQNRMENQVQDYSYGMDLKGARSIRFVVNNESTTTVKDAEGKEVEDSSNLTDEQIAEKGYVKEEIPNNSEEVKTLENYKTSKEIIEKRLKKAGIQNYIIRLDELAGTIAVELTENEETDRIISTLNQSGKFEIIDSETKEVLMDNNDIKSARVMYGSSSSGTTAGTTVYLDIEFSKDGAKKLEEISEKYVKSEETPKDETQTTNNTTDNQSAENETAENTTQDSGETQNEAENATQDNTTTENTENSEETKANEKKITMKIDDNEIMSTSFDDPIRTGKLQLSMGGSSTDKKSIQSSIEQASNMATLLDTGKIPVKYNLEENQYILSEITDKEMSIAIYALLAIVVIGLIVLIIKNKAQGALGVISYIGFISIFSIVLRYTNVVISIEGFLAIAITLILNYILVTKLVSKSKQENIYKEFFIKIIPVIITAITFCFIKWMPISSFGMVMFWGIVLVMVYNPIVTNNLIKIQKGEEK